MQGIIACCNPVPSIVKMELTQLNRIISLARNRPLDAKVQFNRCSTFNVQLSTLDRLNKRHDYSITTKIDHNKSTDFGLYT